MSYKLISFITAALLLAGCTEPIDIKTDNSPPVPVIYGLLTNELKHQEVMVSRSSPYFADVPNVGISGAEVTIQSSDNEFYILSENDTVPGLYSSVDEFSVRSGIQYSLSVEIDFNQKGVKEKYEASTIISPAIVPDSLTFESVSFFGHKNYMLYMHWQDPGEENYYLFHVLYNDSLLTDDLSDYGISNNTLFKGQYVKRNMYFFDDISNRETDLPENRERSVYLQPGDVVTVKTGLISKGYFDFINQCQREKSGENPMFGGPASNIVTNISNGGVGYFAGYCSNRIRIEFEGE